jgi:hypothetical protein
MPAPEQLASSSDHLAENLGTEHDGRCHECGGEAAIWYLTTPTNTRALCVTHALDMLKREKDHAA